MYSDLPQTRKAFGNPYTLLDFNGIINNYGR